MHTRIKICGMTRSEDIEVAVSAGVDAIGLVFYSRSPRFVDICQVQSLIRQLPPFVSIVGLFVNAEWTEIAAVLDQIQLTYLQLHGDETPETCALIRERFHLPVLRAAHVTPELNLDQFADSFVRQAGCSAILLDAWSAHYGGTGKRFDWSLIPAHWLTGPRPKLILSGGLNADNVVQAIQSIRPDVVDVSSGVESDIKGHKDADRIQAFVQAVRTADAVQNI